MSIHIYPLLHTNTFFLSISGVMAEVSDATCCEHFKPYQKSKEASLLQHALIGVVDRYLVGGMA